MKLLDLIASFRVDSDDQARSTSARCDDLLWQDDEVARWLSEAEEEAAIRRRLLPDETTIELAPPARSYPFTLFFEISNAELVPVSGHPVSLHVVSREAMNQLDHEWRRSRRPPAYLIHEDTRVVVPGLIPENCSLQLDGYRLPLKPLRADRPTSSPEIAEVHHRFLVYWALHRAYGKHDADGFDKQKSQTALGEFEAYFGRRPDADLRKDARADATHRNVSYLP